MNPHHHNGKLLLDVIQFTVRKKRYSQIRAILAEASGESDTALRVVLKEQHDIVFGPLDDPWIFYIESSQQLAYLRDAGIANPTNLQLLGTTHVLDIDRDRAIERFRRMHDAVSTIELPGE